MGLTTQSMNETKNSNIGVVVAVVISLFSFFFAVFGGGSGEIQIINDKTAGERAGLQEFIDGIKAGDVNAKWVSKTLPAQTNSVLLYKNTTGKDVIVDYGEVNVVTGETASSTYKVAVFATTSTSVPTNADFAALTGNTRKLSLIDGVTLATSTTATTTSSTYASSAGLGNGAIIIPNGSSLFGFIQQTFTTPCTGSQCETATSSNRGFNPVFNVRVHKSSLNNVGTAQSF